MKSISPERASINWKAIYIDYQYFIWPRPRIEVEVLRVYLDRLLHDIGTGNSRNKTFKGVI